jgi:hypothetical protein
LGDDEDTFDTPPGNWHPWLTIDHSRAAGSRINVTQQKDGKFVSGDKKNGTASAQRSSPRALFYSTTEGRQRFPDILQVSYGEKAVIGFDRYGRALGALVPMEAVKMLAGHGEGEVESGIRDHIQRTAQSLLDLMEEQAEGLPPRELEAGRQRAPQSSPRRSGR